MTSRDPRRSRWRIGLLAAAVSVLVLLGVGAAANGTFMYARTPSLLLAQRTAEHVRLTGTVVPGTLSSSAGLVRFRLRDDHGAAAIDVRTTDAPPQAFREGGQAVVEGRLAGAVFVADRVIAKHGNQYRAPARSQALR